MTLEEQSDGYECLACMEKYIRDPLGPWLDRLGIIRCYAEIPLANPKVINEFVELIHNEMNASIVPAKL